MTNIHTQQEISVTPLPGDEEYVIAEIDDDGSKHGMIPKTYIELL